MTQTAHRRPGEVQDGVLVASVPANHVYVHHIAAEDADGVERLPDPDPDDPRRSAQEAWWPPVMLDPDWIAAADFDVFHLQFGFDAWPPERLRDVVAAPPSTTHTLRLHRARPAQPPPRGPQPARRTARRARPCRRRRGHPDHGSSQEIAERWGRRAHVVPHPHVVDFGTMDTLAARPRPTEQVRIGLHVKSLRASMDPGRLLPTLLRFVSTNPGTVLQVNGHRDLLEPGGARYCADLERPLRDAEAAGLVDLRVHDFMPDAELFAYLASLDVAVLPYRFGTHSGWLEACRDLGTTVVAPSCGYYRDQGPVVSFVNEEGRFDPTPSSKRWPRPSTAPVWGASRRGAPQQRAEISAFHAGLYDSLLNGGGR